MVMVWCRCLGVGNGLVVIVLKMCSLCVIVVVSIFMNSLVLDGKCW